MHDAFRKHAVPKKKKNMNNVNGHSLRIKTLELQYLMAFEMWDYRQKS